MRSLRAGAKLSAAVTLILVLGLARTAAAQANVNPLAFENNYFVTGDYVVGGAYNMNTNMVTIGPNTYTIGTINIPDASNTGITGTKSVPTGAQIVAAFLYWQTVEKTGVMPGQPGSGQIGYFRPVLNKKGGPPAPGYLITGVDLMSQNTVSFSSGGCTGASTGKVVRTYRASVSSYLPQDANGNILANSTYEVRLPSSGNSTPLTLGATLVIIYRVLAPNFPLNSIVIYDGAFAPGGTLLTMTQTLQGFYQAATNPVSRLTHIVGQGKSKKMESVYLNNLNVPLASLYPGQPPFPGFYGTWDNPTWTFGDPRYGNVPNPVKGANASGVGGDSSATTMVAPASSNQGCVSWGAIIVSTTVQNSDGDGILDVWKVPAAPHSNTPGYCDASVNGGQCSGPRDPAWVDLPGAVHGEKDVFIQLDYMCSHPTGVDTCTTGNGTDYSFDPRQTGADVMMTSAFLAQGIHLHINPVNMTGTTQPVHAIQEQTCLDNSMDPTCASVNANGLTPFPGQPGVVGWKAGVEFLKNQPLNPILDGTTWTEAQCENNPSTCIRRFQYGRKDSYHYAVFAHAVGRANWGLQGGSLASVVAFTNGDIKFTTAAPHGLVVDPNLGNGRVTIADATTNPNLNGTYKVTSVSPPAGVLTITQTSMDAVTGMATYTFTQVSGPAPAAGDLVTVQNTTNGSGVFNVVNATIAGVDTGHSTFTVNFNVNGFAPSAIGLQHETGGCAPAVPTGACAHTNRPPFYFTINITPSTVSTQTSYTELTDPNLTVVSGQAGTESGFSDIGGADTLVALGLWGNPAFNGSSHQTSPVSDGQKETVQAGTFMHELGHTLGLTHGGLFYDNLALNPQDYTPTFDANCKSNYQSVMNYMFQSDLLGKNSDVLDFSSQQLDTLNETSLLPITLSGSTSAVKIKYTTWYDLTPNLVGSKAKHHCDGSPMFFNPNVFHLSADFTPIMYPHLNQALPSPWPAVSLDINFDGMIDTGPHGYRGYDDWANVDLRDVGGPGHSGGGPGHSGGGPGHSGGGPGHSGGGPGRNEEIDFDTANGVTRPPRNLTAIEDPSPRFIHLFWFPPTFGQIGSYNIYRQPPWMSGNPPTFSVPVGDPRLIFHSTLGDPHFGEYEFVDKTATCNPTGYQYFVSAVLVNTTQESEPSNIVSTSGQTGVLLTACYTNTPPKVALNNLSFQNATFVQGSAPFPIITWSLQDDDTGTFVNNATATNPPGALAANTLVAFGPFPSDKGCPSSLPAGTQPVTLLRNGMVQSVTGPFGTLASGMFGFDLNNPNAFDFTWDTTNFGAGCWFFQLNLDSGQSETTGTGPNTATALTLFIFVSDNNPHMITTALPNGVVGSAYTNNGSPVTLQEAGGTGPFQWTLDSGSLPTGISLDKAAGTLSGTPCATGPFNFTVRVTDSLMNFGTQPLTLIVTPAAVPQVNQPLLPESSAPGGAGFPVTVNGTGFVPSCSAVLWNGSSRTTIFKSATQLTATILAADVATFGTPSISVATTGSPTSNVDLYQVTNPTTAVSLGRTDIATGTSPNGVIAADFNGDGKLDLAIANSGNNTVSIFLGNGDGTFATPTTLATGVGSGPSSLIAGDFNNDGMLDLAVANFANGTVSIFLGIGNGTFKPAVSYSVGNGPISVITGDFNGDGKLDLAVANQADHTVSILLGNGDGTLQAHKDYAAIMAGAGTLDAGGLAVGDFNADDKLDLAVTNPGTDQVSILFGSGDGSFQNPVSYSAGAAGSSPMAVSAADFNGDGILDLAVTNRKINKVAIFLGNATLGKANGTFQAAVSYSTTGGATTGPGAITTGDFNGDGLLDLAITNQNDNSVSILLGNGTGTFQSPLEFTTGNFSAGVAAGDFNGDGRLDVAVANQTDNTVSIMLQPQVLLVPSALPFGPVAEGASTPAAVSLTNNGPGALTISSIAFGGANPGDFTEKDNCPTSPSTLAAGLSCTITVTFAPTATGARNAALSVTYPGTGSPQMVNLTGSGFVAAPANLVATPGASAGAVNLGWSASPSAAGGYNVYRSTTSGSYTSSNKIASAVALTSYPDSGLASGTTYYYVVTAVDASGNESPFSTEASVVAP